MSKRNLIIAAVVLVILAIISQWIDRSGQDNKDDRIGNALLSASQIESFDRMQLRDADHTVTLQKQGDQWTIKEKQDYPVNMKQLLEVMEKLVNEKIVSLVTRDENRYGYFQVVYWDQPAASADSSGTQLTLYQGDQEIFSLITGKSRQPGTDDPNTKAKAGGVYVRVDKEPAVYLLEQNLFLNADPGEWIQNTLFSLDKKEIKEVQYEVSGSQFTLQRPDKDKAMTLSGLGGGEEVVDSEVGSVLSDLENFEIESIFPKDEIPMQELALKSLISVSSYDAPTLQFRVFSKLIDKSLKEDDKDKYAYYISFVRPRESSADDKWKGLYELNDRWIFKMDSWNAERWLKTRKDFIKDTLKK